MTDNTSHISLPLEILLSRLKAAGFAVDTSRQLRMLKALEQNGTQFVGNWEEIKYLLAPLICRSAQEQRKFYIIFDTFREECEKEILQPPTAPPPVKKIKKYWWILVLLLLGVLLYIVNQSIRTQTYSFPALLTDTFREGDTLTMKDFSAGTLDSTSFEIQIVDKSTGKTAYSADHQHFQWLVEGEGKEKYIIINTLGTASKDSVLILCADPPASSEIILPKGVLYTGNDYFFEIKTDKDNLVEWYFNDRDTLTGSKVKYRIGKESAISMTARIFRPGKKTYCFSETSANITIANQQAYLRYAALHEDTPQLILQLSRLAWLLILSPLLGILFFLGRWWWKRQKKETEKSIAQLETEFAINDAAPYSIPYLPQEHKITVPRDFFRIADAFRRRESDIRTSFDVHGSVRATIDAGGFPEWREKANSRPSEFLLLVTLRTGQDQQGRLFERLCHFLKRREAPAEIYFHDGNFRQFWKSGFPESVNLNILKRLYPYHRLILAGDAHGLVHPFDTRRPVLQQSVLDDLLRWQRRLLLTPEPVSAWSFQEALLYRHFLLYPADTDGMLQGVNMLDRTEEYEAGSFEKWQNKWLKPGMDANHRYRTWDTIADHRDYLQHDPEAYRWLCALSVCVQPDWALTIAIGRAIGVEVTHDRLLRLTRIPWLRSNESNDHLRFQFLQELDTDMERLARKAVADELEAVREQTAGGFAEIERKTNAAVHHFALDPHDETHKQTIRELLAMGLFSGSQVAELDFIVQEKTTREGRPASAFSGIQAWLDTPVPQPLFTKDIKIALFLLSLTLLLVLGGWQYNKERNKQDPATADIAFWQSTAPLDDDAIRLNNEAVAIGKDLLSGSTYQGWSDTPDTARWVADSLFQRAISQRQPGFYALADSNRYALRYNVAARNFNYYLDEPGLRINSLRLAGEQFRIIEILWKDQPARRLDALHGVGLHYYLMSKASPKQVTDMSAQQLVALRDSALAVYQQIVAESDSVYFDTLSMAVNLRTLLEDSKKIEALPYQLQMYVIDEATRRPLSGVRITPAGLPPLTTNSKGIATYNFKRDPVTSRLNARVQRQGYNDWNGQLLARTSSGMDTIVLTEKRVVADRDGDGILDAADKCPDEKGIATFEGCPPSVVLVDSDGDGIVDAADACPEEKGTVEYKGCPPPVVPTDSDGDGIADTADDCPKDKGTVATKGCPDRDGDGIADAVDKCPDEKGILPDGCPKPNTYTFSEPEMILVKAGTFTMGCTDEQGKECEKDEYPAHQVRLTKDYHIGKYEVTNEEFAAFLNEYGSAKVKTGSYSGQVMIDKNDKGISFPDPKGDGLYRPQSGFEKYPVVSVSWYGAYTYCQWLSGKTGKNYRLPTEAEWEFAARGGNQSKGYKYSGSDKIDEVAWYIDNSKSQTHPVGLLMSNELGIYDMSGNVYEWCADWYDERYYADFPKGATDPKGARKGDGRVLRGGSWGISNNYCRVAVRSRGDSISGGGGSGGFRLAQD